MDFIGYDVTGGEIEYQILEPMGANTTHMKVRRRLAHEAGCLSEAVPVQLFWGRSHGQRVLTGFVLWCVALAGGDADAHVQCRQKPKRSERGRELARRAIVSLLSRESPTRSCGHRLCAAMGPGARDGGRRRLPAAARL